MAITKSDLGIHDERLTKVITATLQEYETEIEGKLRFEQFYGNMKKFREGT